MKFNFRRGGLFLLPSVVLANIIAVAVNAPAPVFVSISTFGFVTVIVLLLLGDKRETQSEQNG